MRPPEMGKHKKHKSDRRERYENPTDAAGRSGGSGLKLILKVGNQGTPEHNTDWHYSNNGAVNQGATYSVAGEDAVHPSSLLAENYGYSVHRSHHKKSKKKKKKKDKSKDRDKERKHRKEKKRKKLEAGHEDDEASMDTGSLQGSGSIALNVGSPSGRELRQCVLRQRQERTPLQRALENVLKKFEKRDPNQFFAWPVTDSIAPGYSAIITHPMDFCTMRQKIDDNQYGNFQDFMADFKLVCTNAMQYNHVDTIYYKASKKLLQAGLKLVQPDKIGWLLVLTPDVTSRDLGFEILPELRQEHRPTSSTGDVDDQDDTDSGRLSADVSKKRMPISKFEAIPDDLSPEEILASVQSSSREAKIQLALKRGGPGLGYLKQRKDGSTHLNIIVGGDGVIPGTKKRPVLLGALTGKLLEGTSQLQGFREDRRNVAKPVKPLYYGAFGSYAPSYDSAFANLSKEESDLVYQTYGSDTSVQYAESILDFAKDCDYTLQMVDSLLDLLTGGDHSKTKKVLEEKKMLREEEDAIKTVLEIKPTEQPHIDVDNLRGLTEQGINMDFLEDMEEDIRALEDFHELQQRLDSNSQLLDKLQHTQQMRLSAALPTQLNSIQPPSEEEIALADTVTGNLTDIVKRINPGDVAPIQGIHKALGVNLPSDMEVGNADVPDLESELRQFLESEPSLAQSPLRDDKTIEEILME